MTHNTKNCTYNWRKCAISLYMICPLGVENRNLKDISGKAATIGAF